jgi:hypothetical protein
MGYNEPVKVHRAFAYTAPVGEDQPAELPVCLDCKSLFNGRNITTDFDDMWCTSFTPGDKFCHIVMDLGEPREITGHYLGIITYQDLLPYGHTYIRSTARRVIHLQFDISAITLEIRAAQSPKCIYLMCR